MQRIEEPAPVARQNQPSPSPDSDNVSVLDGVAAQDAPQAAATQSSDGDQSDESESELEDGEIASDPMQFAGPAHEPSRALDDFYDNRNQDQRHKQDDALWL
jgi:hypothetical protein